MQFQSDILGTPVDRPIVSETTALGAAYLAGLAVGYWKDREEISKQWKIETTFTNKLDREISKKLYEGWQRAVAATRAFKA